MKQQQIFNQLPRPTFRWLKVNYTESSWEPFTETIQSHIVPEGDMDVVAPLMNTALLDAEFTGANAESLHFVANSFTDGFFIDVPAGVKKSVIIPITLTANEPNRAIRVRVHGRVASEIEIVYLCQGASNGQFHLLTEVETENQAKVTIKKVQLFGEDVYQIEHRLTKLAEQSNVEFINVELGGKENIYHFVTALTGKGSGLTHDIAYLGDGEQKFDLSLLMTHEGKKSTSDVHALGALTGVAKKSFRGTLDFLRGSTGSEGAEEDTCLLLNDAVKSISLPLLLCKEDDVAGNHAASAGQLDPSKLFYIMSRGFNEQEAKHILVESMLRPIIDRIGHEAVEAAALELIRNKI